MHGGGSVPNGGQRIRVLLGVIDFPLLMAGLRAAVEAEPDMTVVGQAADRNAMHELIASTPADVVLVEVVPFGSHGCTTFQAIEEIRANRPTTRIVALECRAGGDQFSMALKAGADGYLTRSASIGDVVTAIRSVSRGQTYVSPDIVTAMVSTYVLHANGAGGPTATTDAYDRLSDREREVLMLAAVGHTNREIAKALHLAEQTVHNYRAGIMEKLGFHDRVELLKFAIRRGVLDVADL